MILLGTKNLHKVEEVRAIVEPLGVRVAMAVALPEVEETGATFLDNARLKANGYALHCRGPVLADDSGLVVPALGGEPGVRSARYAGEPPDDRRNIDRLLERVRAAGLHEPEAYFACVMVLAVPGKVLIEAEGRVEGRLLAEPRGDGGFGYDPVFFHPPSGRTFAELDPAEKNAVSHRARALAAVAERIPGVADYL